MKILLVVTGSISAFKSIELANSLRYLSHDVRIVLTSAATQFVSKLVFTGQRYECFTEEDEWAWGQQPGVLHVELAKWADILIVAPATINTIGKFISGITDSLALSVMRAFSGMIYVAPAMNTQMYLNSASIIKKLWKRNCYVIPPQKKLLACGDLGDGALASKDDIIQALVTNSFPLRRKFVGITSDSDSYLNISWHKEVELPTSEHCGGFGFIRTHHIHEGIDLYAPEGEPVYACEEGKVGTIRWFTGQRANSPWWENTQMVAIINSKSEKISLYGEIQVVPWLGSGDHVKKGQHLGNVVRVLKKNKGRPMSMLHFERYNNSTGHTIFGCRGLGVDWIAPNPKPHNLVDPFNFLNECLKRERWMI